MRVRRAARRPAPSPTLEGWGTPLPALKGEAREGEAGEGAAREGGGPGACCVDASTCFQNASPGNCVDLGGVWQGAGTTCAQITCVNPPACPAGSVAEGEPNCGQPAPDNFNSGCLVIGGAFTFLANNGCGQVICGTASADLRNGGAAGRDSDFYFFIPQSTTGFRACVEAPFHPQVQLVELNDGIDPCASQLVVASAAGLAGQQACVEQCLLRGVPHAATVTTVDVNGDPQPEGIACVPYVLRTTCAACASGACCLDADCVSGVFPTGEFAGETVSAPNCAAQGGVYLGDGVSCAGALCRAACCLPDGQCSLLGRSSCLAAGGAWFADQACADVLPCPVCQGEDPLDLDDNGDADEDCSSLPPVPVNSGCDTNAAGTAFTPIACGDTVCGSTAFDGFERDFDWYHFSVAQTTDARFALTNQSGGQLLFLVRWYSVQSGLPACPTGPDALRELLAPASLTTVPVDATLRVPLVLAPGRYTLVVTHRVNPLGPPTPLACPAPYRLAVSCSTTPCDFACGPGAAAENEPACGASAQTNAGCFDVVQPGGFSTLFPGQRVCGTSRLVRGLTPQGFATLDRDFDWWRIALPAGEWLLQFQGEFHALVEVRGLDANGDCESAAVLRQRVPRCDSSPPVTFAFQVGAARDFAVLVTPEAEFYRSALLGAAAAAGTEEPCPAHYELRISPAAGDCAGIVCADSNLNGVVSVGDIGAFVTAVTQGFAAWEAALPGVQTQAEFLCANDTDRNSVVSVGDIARFVSSALASQSQCAGSP